LEGILNHFWVLQLLKPAVRKRLPYYQRMDAVKKDEDQKIDAIAEENEQNIVAV